MWPQQLAHASSSPAQLHKCSSRCSHAGPGAHRTATLPRRGRSRRRCSARWESRRWRALTRRRTRPRPPRCPPAGTWAPHGAQSAHWSPWLTACGAESGVERAMHAPSRHAMHQLVLAHPRYTRRATGALGCSSTRSSKWHGHTVHTCTARVPADNVQLESAVHAKIAHA